MSLVEQLPAEVYLRRRHVRFEVAPHPDAYTARSEARALGLPSDYVIKAVVLSVDGDCTLAVLPASRKVDLNLVSGVFPGATVRLASEEEIASRFPGYQLGALPPFPGLLGVRGLIDPVVFDHDEDAFADGRRTESIIASPREIYWGEDVFVSPISREPEPRGPWELPGEVLYL